MAHPHLALAIVLIVLGLAAAVWLAALLTDPNRELKAALGEDAGVDILPGSTWHPADDDDSPAAEQSTIPGRPALYVISSTSPHTPKGRHRR